ncbi:MAG: metallophosphoesterase [Bacilli bacterium]|nr:metallophosphoesterase [Bacilli bacterium]
MKKKIIIGFIVTFILFLSVLLWARFIGTKGLVVKEYGISVQISDNFDGLKIVHFSDLHYGMTINSDKLEEVVDKINFIKPDIVVFTGDLVDKKVSITDDEKSALINLLKSINASLGKYAVSGNHDISNFDNIMDQSGFEVLNNTYELIYNKNNNPILIAGVTSNLLDTASIDEKLKSTYEFLSTNSIQYKILLMHEPDFIDNIQSNTFNLVLSGHSHGGQVRLPFVGALVKVIGAKKYYDSYYKVNNTDLYISSGLGTTWYKVRLFDKPSFNFYRIQKGS